jgi:hypothetical protein
LKDLLHNWGKIECELGKISRFENKEYDVLKVEVKSKDIKKLHSFLCKHYEDKITTDFPEWKGHITLAYVKHGTHKELNGDKVFDGQKYTFTDLIYSTPGMKKKTKFTIA